MSEGLTLENRPQPLDECVKIILGGIKIKLKFYPKKLDEWSVEKN
jgi:hypothetical protein